MSVLLFILIFVLMVWLMAGPMFGTLLVLGDELGQALPTQVALLLWNFAVFFTGLLLLTGMPEPTPPSLHWKALNLLAFHLLFVCFVGGMGGCGGVHPLFMGLAGALFVPVAIGYGSGVLEAGLALARPEFETYKIISVKRLSKDETTFVEVEDKGSGEFDDESIDVSPQAAKLLAAQPGERALTMNILSRTGYLPGEVEYPASRHAERPWLIGVSVYALLYPVLATSLLWASVRRSRRGPRPQRVLS